MKDNIDLTEDRDFRRKIDVTEISRAVMQTFGCRFPWQINNKVSNYTDERSLVFTGSKEDRKQKCRYKTFENGLMCERCGADLSKKPWNMKYTLCMRCEKEMDLDYDKNRDLVIFRLKRSHLVRTR